MEVSILVSAVAINSVLLGFVYVRNPKSATHRLFALLVIVMSLWSITNFFAVNATAQPAATWLVRGVMFFAAPMSVTFFLLMHTFPRSSLSMSRRALFIWTSITLLTMAAAISPLVFPRVDLVHGSAPKPQPGPGMILFGPVAIGTIPLGIFYLIRKFRKSTGTARTQIQFLILGVVTMFALIVLLNFLSVVIFNTSAFNRFGPLFTLPFTILAAYTMLRYRFLDVRVAILRSLSLTSLVASVLGVYGLLFVFAVPWLSTLTGVPVQILAAAAALASIPVARLVQRGLTKITDKFLFQNRVDFEKVLEATGKSLSATIDINEATSIILQTMQEVLRSRKTAILLRRPETKTYELRAQTGMKGFQATIQPDNVIVRHLQHAEGIIVKDELALAKEQAKTKSHAEEIEVIEEAMNWLDIQVVVPLFVNKELTGLVILGDKLSGTPYLQGDIGFLNTLASQASVVLENARLYKESLEFGEKLKLEVERATKELAEANVQLKNLDKAKSEFLSIASHQLYTPLTALRGYVSMLQEGDFGKVPEKQQPILDILDKSAHRLIDLIKGLLDISRIERGKLELNLESTDLVQMAKELVRDLIPNAVKKNLNLEFIEPKNAVAHAVVDSQRLRQVMLNFIDNAIKYTDKGEIKVTVNQEAEQIKFAVTDTGKGISATDIARLFNKFTRVGGAARFHTEGTGLGLYVARQIVKEHHGDVEVTSPGEGKGSTFAMILPAEGTPNALKVGDKATVEIKAAEAAK